MKRFIFTILCVSTFFLGAGAIIQRVGMSFKPDREAVFVMERSQMSADCETKIQTIKTEDSNGKIIRIDNIGPKPEGKLQIHVLRTGLPSQIEELPPGTIGKSEKPNISFILSEQAPAESHELIQIPEETPVNKAE